MIFRIVVDTNVVIAAHRAPSSGSPNCELLSRWKEGRLTFLYSTGTIDEYAEKLQDLTSLTDEEIVRFLALIQVLGEFVFIEVFHFAAYPSDPDDIPFFLCAANGDASHLVTYDSDFDSIRDLYDFQVARPAEVIAELDRLEDHSTDEGNTAGKDKSKEEEQEQD